jgi:predicted nucleotidyltransferase
MVKRNGSLKSIIRKFIHALKSRGIRANRIILYGSYARGTAKSYSDIDLAVISSDFKGKGILKRQELLGETIFEAGAPIEAIGYTLEECHNYSPFSFLAEILSTGKVVYKKS